MKPNRSKDPMHPQAEQDQGSQKRSCSEIEFEPPPSTCGAKTRSGLPCKNLVASTELVEIWSRGRRAELRR